MGTLLNVKDLSIGFADHGKLNKAVEDVSFSMEEREILGVVGESGSGKSMTALATMGLLPKAALVLGGEISFAGQDMLRLSADERSRIQGKDLSMIFQEPMTSLNPVMKIGKQVGESLLLHTDFSKEEIHQKVLESLSEVGLSDPETLCEKYPHELSGGMRQRVMIAQAMICSPKLLIADEPTTALDVIVQEQILTLLKSLHEKKDVAILFISHDLGVIREICQNVLVMYHGVIVERGSVEDVLYHPQHAYTKTLVASIPSIDTPATSQKTILSMEHVDIYYPEGSGGLLRKRKMKKVVKDLNLSVYEGEIMGIVGESGCGKSTIARTVVGLNNDYTGTMQLEADARPQMVFQDPYGSLNPARRIGWIMAEPLRVRGIKDKAEQKRLVLQMLQKIGLDDSYYDRYARELSGGQRQRISIGTALLMDSRLLVADEPVSALDVTVQSQILNLLLDVHRQGNLAILFISHDLNIVEHICHRVAVIYLGEIVEMADVEEIYQNPRHPYTRMLLQAALLESQKSKGKGIFSTSEKKQEKEQEVVWDIEDVKTEEKGCAFYPRCPERCAECLAAKQELKDISSGSSRPHLVRCARATKDA